MKSYLTVGHMGKGRIGVGRMEANKIGTSHTNLDFKITFKGGFTV